ncbi:MAG: response regulator [Chitinophagaceae bacterium]|nr:response regulator [Chitinophagaceae bacterium]MCW5926940.1 response regulator [Chitinophagaceae bacterium]
MKTNFLDKIVSAGYSILSSGADPSKSHEEKKSIERLVIFIFFGIGVSLISAVLNSFRGLYISLLLNITTILLLTVSFFLNKDGRMAFAKVLGIVVINFYLFAISYVEGLKSGEHMFYFPFLLALIFVIDLRKNYEELIMTAIVTFITAAMIFILAPYSSTVQVISSEQYSALFSSNLSLSLVITAFFTYYILQTIERNEDKILDEKYFKETIYDTSLDASFIVDINTLAITDCNKTSLEIFSIESKDAIVGTMVRDLLGNKMEEHILVQGKQDFTKKSPWYGNMDFFRQDNTPFYGYVSLVAFSHSNAQYCKISILDITEIKVAEFEILKAKEKAEKAAQVKSRFLSNMSHELRTPLNAIIGTTNLVLQEEYLPSQLQSFEVLKYSSEHMMQLVNDILDFSKIEAGKMQLENTQFSLKNFLQKVVASFNSPVAAKNLDFKVEIDDNTDLEIYGDEMRLNQIMNNLLSNALKFTQQGTIEVVVKTIALKSSNADVFFSVSDTGIGIPKNKIRQIFESFTQADIETTRKYGGTGLGLAITQRIVEQMGGALKVDSETEKGSTFYFTLNFQVTKQQRSYVNEDKLKNLSGLDGLKVLLAEDNPINMLVARRFLQKWNIEVVEADNGVKAVELFYQTKPDLLLVDLEMPEMDGAQTVAEIRKTHPGIPIIAFTAATYENIREDLLSKGFNDYIPKPFKPEELHKKILEYATANGFGEHRQAS